MPCPDHFLFSQPSTTEHGRRRRRRRRRGGRICNSGIDSIPEVTSGIGGTGRREGREKHRRHSGRNGCVYPSAGSGRRRGGGWGGEGEEVRNSPPIGRQFLLNGNRDRKARKEIDTHRQKNDHHSPPLLLLTEKIIKKNSNSFKDNYIQTQGKFRPRKLTISFHYLYFFCWFFVGFFFWIIDLNFI